MTDKKKKAQEPERNEYNDQSISALKGADRIRLKPAAILGSDGLEGCEHAFFEILANSVDEAREGYGNVIKVTVTKDMIITVEDDGRGIPLNYNEKEGRYNWDLIFCELYAGGKYQHLLWYLLYLPFLREPYTVPVQKKSQLRRLTNFREQTKQ